MHWAYENAATDLRKGIQSVFNVEIYHPFVTNFSIIIAVLHMLEININIP